MFKENEITREQLAVIFPAITLATTFAVGLGLRKLQQLTTPNNDTRRFTPSK
jgi:hypothetical protein